MAVIIVLLTYEECFQEFEAPSLDKAHLVTLGRQLRIFCVPTLENGIVQSWFSFRRLLPVVDKFERSTLAVVDGRYRG
jgi:hypothetical protein